MMMKPNKKILKHWDYKSTYNEAQKYKSRGEFKKGSPCAYTSARKHKWLDDYDWFIQKHKQKGYWNYETCRLASKNCVNRSEFHKLFPSAEKVSRKNNWIDDFFPKIKKESA